jgi:hypothetical protein
MYQSRCIATRGPTMVRGEQYNGASLFKGADSSRGMINHFE